MASRRSVLFLVAAAGLAMSVPASGAVRMKQVVLLGDSTLDNAAYVVQGDEVIAQLRRVLPAGWTASLLAKDGAMLADVINQLQRVPSTASHLVISAGGNDALGASGLLRQPSRSVADSLTQIADVRDAFATAYHTMLDAAQGTGMPLVICTIYDAQLPDLTERRLAATALAVLNDVITRQASARRLPLIDLRVLFDNPGDYANAIEPSGLGGAKIATAIADLVVG